MRFFDLNIAHKSFPGTYDAISEAANAESCFDGLNYTFWSSNGYADDDLSIWLERDFGATQTFDRIFVQDTNITDISLQYWNGSIWVTASATITKSNDLRSILFEFTSLAASKFRLIGSHTAIVDEEKVIGSVFAFTEIGELVIPPSGITAKRVKEQDDHKLISGKSFIFNRGRRWEISLTLKAHIGQDDISLLESLVKRDNEFHIWINNDTEASMAQIVEPYGFKDMIKVSVAGGDNPNYYKNLFFSGVANTFLMTEVE